MSDLIERLRSPASGNVLLCRKAADEIEQLRDIEESARYWQRKCVDQQAEIERLRAANKKLRAERKELKGRVEPLQNYFDTVEDYVPDFLDDNEKYWDAKVAVLGPLEEIDCTECWEPFMPETYDWSICPHCWERILENEK